MRDMSSNPIPFRSIRDSIEFSFQVLTEKRRKLIETWHRVIKMYEKDDVEQYVELKKLWHSYQGRKQEVVQQFEAVRNALNVSVDTIPLPSGPGGEGDDPDSIPLPPTRSR
jgi:hypothetical protein